MGDVYALSPFWPISIVKSVQGGGGFSSGHKWGILGGRQGLFKIELDDYAGLKIRRNWTLASKLSAIML